MFGSLPQPPFFRADKSRIIRELVANSRVTPRGAKTAMTLQCHSVEAEERRLFASVPVSAEAAGRGGAGGQPVSP